MNAIQMKIVTPRGTMNIHTNYANLEEAGVDGWHLWFQHENYLILNRENRCGAVVTL